MFVLEENQGRHTNITVNKTSIEVVDTFKCVMSKRYTTRNDVF